MLEAVLVAMIALVILDTDMFKVQVLVSECGDLGSATIAARDELESRLNENRKTPSISLKLQHADFHFWMG